MQRRSRVRTTAPASRSEPGLEPGHRVGRYVITRRLGAGGNGVVYAAQDPDLQRQVAIKVLHPRLAETRQSHARLLREAQAMARLSHSNVVPIYDVGTTGDHVFLAMELLEAGTLGDWIDGARGDWRETLPLVLAAGRGLAAAHGAGMIHRDFKPENVLLGRRGEVRVTDFGLARAVSEVPEATPSPDAVLPPATTATAVVGTAGYLAPEIFFGKPVDYRSDLFSFCVTLYEALYGERPFADPADGVTTIAGHIACVSSGRVEPAPHGSEVPAWLRKVVLRGLAVDPAQRWPSIDALIAAIEHGLRRDRSRWPRSPAGAAVILSVTGAIVAVTVLTGSAEPVPAIRIDLPIASPAPEPDPIPALAQPAALPIAPASDVRPPATPPTRARRQRRRPAPAPPPAQTAPVDPNDPDGDGIPDVRIRLDDAVPTGGTR